MHEMPILELRIRKAVRRNGSKLLVADRAPDRARRRRRDRLRRLPRGTALRARRRARVSSRACAPRSSSGDGGADAAGFAEALRDAGPIVRRLGRGDARRRRPRGRRRLAARPRRRARARRHARRRPLRGPRSPPTAAGCARSAAQRTSARDSPRRPQRPFDADEIREALESGEIEALILGDVDPVRDFDDPEGWKRALVAANFTLSISMFAGASAHGIRRPPAGRDARREGGHRHPPRRAPAAGPALGPASGRGAAAVAGAQRALGATRRRDRRRHRRRGLRAARRRRPVLRGAHLRPDRRRRDSLAGGQRNEASPVDGPGAPPPPCRDATAARRPRGRLRLGTYHDLWADYVAEREPGAPIPRPRADARAQPGRRRAARRRARPAGPSVDGGGHSLLPTVALRERMLDGTALPRSRAPPPTGRQPARRRRDDHGRPAPPSREPEEAPRSRRRGGHAAPPALVVTKREPVSW